MIIANAIDIPESREVRTIGFMLTEWFFRVANQSPVSTAAITKRYRLIFAQNAATDCLAMTESSEPEKISPKPNHAIIVNKLASHGFLAINANPAVSTAIAVSPLNNK